MTATKSGFLPGSEPKNKTNTQTKTKMKKTILTLFAIFTFTIGASHSFADNNRTGAGSKKADRKSETRKVEKKREPRRESRSGSQRDHRAMRPTMVHGGY